ncbi:MAG: glycerophosphodiester phosphodiesterase, partial [Clostridia bacterium]|nr:glycerophosphodiester phosphodiesterase [Deltaproteobacteria bacterium]
AHRGASLHAPENTLEAFELGVLQGANVLELDVHMTRDGEIVVMHDATVDRTTNGTGEVRAMTYAQIQQLDAGYHFVDRSGRTFFRDRDVTVPTLAEVLQAFPRVGFNIEIKQADAPMVAQTLQLLDRLKPENVLLTAGNDAIMQALEAANPSYALGMSHGQCRAVVKGASFEGFRGRALQVPPRYLLMRVVTKKLLARAHAAGVEVHVWTVNDARKAKPLVALGVDGVMSDDPGALVDVMRVDSRS